jgi:hypothetical protein
MTEKNDGLQERQLSLAVRKAFRQLLKDIESEPTLVIEAGSDSRTDTALLRDVQGWLFRRGEEHNDD